MNKFITAIAIGIAAATATATAFAWGADQQGEKISADLTLLQKGEMTSVHFSPSFEEELSDKEEIVFRIIEDKKLFVCIGESID